MKTLKAITLFLFIGVLPACGQPLVKFAHEVVVPTVTSVVPANATPGVAISTKVTATFSVPMNSATVTAPGAFTLTGPLLAPVTGAVTYDVASQTAIFAPSADLAKGTAYTATISIGAKDPAGTALAVPFVWTFSTGVVADTTAPLVSHTDPLFGATNVPINTGIVAYFSEAMDPTTIKLANVTVAGPSGNILGVVTPAPASSAATFAPTGGLASSTVYTVTIKGVTGVKDLTGNFMTANYVWNFTTGAVVDLVHPQISVTVPANTGTNPPFVAVNATVNATFTKPMDPTTMITANFTLTDASLNSVAGTVAYDAQSDIATFMPTNLLTPGATYTAYVTPGAMDITISISRQTSALPLPGVVTPPSTGTLTSGMFGRPNCVR